MVKVFRMRLAAISAFVLLLGTAHAFPEKTVQLVVPYGAGPADVLGRITATCLSPRLKQAVIVLNKPGANALIGNNFVKMAPPDGHTIILTASAAITDLATSKAPAFDIRQDLEPITKLALGVQGLYVNAALPIRSVKELVDYAKAHPAELNFASTGIGSVNHISTEALAITTGIKTVHVPFPQGTGPFLTAMMGGQIQFAMTDVSGAQAAVDSGKVRLIGVLTRERVPSRPDIPTIVESFPEMAAYTGTLWYGFFAPPKTPKDIVQKLYAEITACVNDPQVRVQLKKFGYEDDQIIVNTPEQFRNSILEDVGRVKDIVQRANIPLR